MLIHFNCECGNPITMAEKFAGKRCRCKQCGRIVTVPAGDAGSGPQTAGPAAAASIGPAAPRAERRPSTPGRHQPRFSSSVPNLGRPGVSLPADDDDVVLIPVRAATGERPVAARIEPTTAEDEPVLIPVSLPDGTPARRRPPNRVALLIAILVPAVVVLGGGASVYLFRPPLPAFLESRIPGYRKAPVVAAAVPQPASPLRPDQRFRAPFATASPSAGRTATNRPAPGLPGSASNRPAPAQTPAQMPQGVPRPPGHTTAQPSVAPVLPIPPPRRPEPRTPPPEPQSPSPPVIKAAAELATFLKNPPSQDPVWVQLARSDVTEEQLKSLRDWVSHGGILWLDTDLARTFGFPLVFVQEDRVQGKARVSRTARPVFDGVLPGTEIGYGLGPDHLAVRVPSSAPRQSIVGLLEWPSGASDPSLSAQRQRPRAPAARRGRLADTMTREAWFACAVRQQGQGAVIYRPRTIDVTTDAGRRFEAGLCAYRPEGRADVPGRGSGPDRRGNMPPLSR